MGNIRTYEPQELGYKMLQHAADIMNYYAAEEGCKPLYSVGDCYFDFGQDWSWTTILYNTDGRNSFQALYANQHEKITGGCVHTDFLHGIVTDQLSILQKA